MVAPKLPARIEAALARMDGYIRAVSKRKLAACKWVRLAIKRHRIDLRDGHERGLQFNREKAGEAIAWIESLKHSKGKWAGSNLHLSDWQCFLVGCLFGWEHKDTGIRRFRLAYWEIARKNGKSTLGAAIALKLFVADREPGAEVYSAATSREQSKIVHEEAKRMVRKHPILKRCVKITRDNMAFGDSKYQPLPADGSLLDGRSVSGAIIDELHAHSDRDLFDVIDTGTGSREQPLLVMITTAGRGTDLESIGLEHHEYTKRILEGVVDDDAWFGVIFCLDEADDWTDEAVWPKANPNLDVSVYRHDLKAKVRKAKNTPAATLAIRQKHFNEWVGAFSSWLAPELWNSCAGDVQWYSPEGLTPEAVEHFSGRDCFVGLDLSSVRDLTALVAAFPTSNGVELLTWAWCPRENVESRSRARRGPFQSFAEQGFLEISETSSVDYDAIRGLLRRLRDEYRIDVREIAADPHNATYLLNQLVTEDGWHEDDIIEHRQSPIGMNGPIKSTEKLILDGRLVHGGHKLLAWCVSNVITSADQYENLRLDKKKSREKIDAAVAMVMAVGRAVGSDEGADASVYDTRGAIFV